MFPVEPKDASVVGLLKKAVHSEKHLWDLFKVNADQLKVYTFDSSKTLMNEDNWWNQVENEEISFQNVKELNKMKPSAAVSFSHCVVQVPVDSTKPSPPRQLGATVVMECPELYTAAMNAQLDLNSTESQVVDVGELLNVLYPSEVESSQLYVRHFASRLYDMMCNLRGGNQVLLGTPGVGKSVFLTYILIRCVKAGHPVIFYRINEKNGWLFHQGKCLRYGDVKIPHEYRHVLSDANIWVLLDKATGGAMYYPHPLYGRATLASSPKKFNYHEFFKTGLGGRIFYYPYWSLVEVLDYWRKIDLASKGITQETVRARYEMVGGLVRTVGLDEARYIVHVDQMLSSASSNATQLYEEYCKFVPFGDLLDD